MRDNFAIQEGFNNWEHAMDMLSDCQNGFILDDFIDDFLKYINNGKNRNQSKRQNNR